MKTIMYFFNIGLIVALCPFAAFAECNICGDGREIGNPDGQLSNPDDASQTASCADVQAQDNLIPPDLCRVFPRFVGNICECRDIVVDTPAPTANPTRETPSPTPEPTATPTPEPTATPTESPTPEPTSEPTFEPTPEPTATPTPEPTEEPTPSPTPAPTIVATASPTETAVPDIASIAVASEELSILVLALEAAGLVGALTDPSGPYTVFAPLNSAFEALPNATVAALLLPENADMLADVLLYHTVNGAFLSTDLADGMMVETLQGDAVAVSIDESSIMIDDSVVVIADVVASNGVVHIIDEVLLYPGFGDGNSTLGMNITDF